MADSNGNATFRTVKEGLEGLYKIVERIELRLGKLDGDLTATVREQERRIGELEALTGSLLDRVGKLEDAAIQRTERSDTERMWVRGISSVAGWIVATTLIIADVLSRVFLHK